MQNLLEKDERLIWHPFAPLKDTNETLLVESAIGNYINLADGRKILDAISSWWVNIHGHGNEELAQTIGDQARNLDHVIFAGFTHQPALELVEGLLKELPEGMRRAFFSDDGSTAVEVALKLGVQFWENQGESKVTILALEGAYHGDTFGSMSLGGKSEFFKAFHNMLFDVEVLPFPEGDGQNTLQAIDEVLSKIDKGVFVYEPLVQGSAGMRIYSPEVLEQILQKMKQKEVVCIADEVMTGFGRTGKMFASLHVETPPDIVCLSKGITGGIMPLGLTVVNDRIEAAFNNDSKAKAFYHGHSFTGNPLSSAVAVKSLEILKRDTTQQNIKRITSSHEVFAQEIKKHPKVLDVKTMGTIISIELKNDEGTSYFNGLRDFLYQHFLADGLLLRPLGNVVYILPPYSFGQEELERCYKSIKNVLEKI